MIPAPRYLLCWSAAPALALSVWLLRIAEAPRSLLTLQIGAVGVAVAICVVLTRMRRGTRTVDPQWLALALTSSLFIPLVSGSDDGPERWIALGSVRVYLVPVVLPVALFLLGATPRVPAVYAASVIAAAIALLGQPDAAQVTAFAAAILVLLATSRLHVVLRVVLAAMLLSGAVVAWQTPDPLAPVAYVEGVFGLAADVSTLALLAALVAAALPVIALAWVARATRSHGVLAVGAYYAALLALAPWQVTPVPLLGFGAGPILGYFLVTGAIARGTAGIHSTVRLSQMRGDKERT